MENQSPANNLDKRLGRVYAAIGMTIDSDIQKAVRFSREGNKVSVRMDGGMSPAEIENAAYNALNLIAHFPEHLKKWLRENSRSVEHVQKLYDSSFPYQLALDLTNTDKHAGFERGGGHSKKKPVLTKLSRGLNFAPNKSGTPGQAVVRFKINDDNAEVEVTEGAPQIMIDGEIHSSDGEYISTLSQLLTACLDHIEDVMKLSSDAADKPGLSEGTIGSGA